MIYKRRDRRTRRFFARNVVEPQRADYFRLWDRLKEVKEMTVNITPLHDRVLVRRLEEKETAKGGIIVPDTAKEKPQEGEVMAVGAGKMEKGHRVPLDVKVGDRILVGKYNGNDIKIDGQEYLILREEEILAKVSGIAKAASGKK
jgi:chaperonin GroES